MDLKQVFANNSLWIQEKLAIDPHYFDVLSKGQFPEILYIGCSDSRVTAEELMGAKQGEVFVQRNIANVVSNTDLNVMSVINYAVSHLKVKHIVVCGQYYCGGVKAAMQEKDMGILNSWLGNIRDVYRLYQEELDAIENEETRYNKLIEFNVREQCFNVLKLIEVQTAYIERGLSVHGWVFDITTGKIVDLKIDFASIGKQLESIYRIV